MAGGHAKYRFRTPHLHADAGFEANATPFNARPFRARRIPHHLSAVFKLEGRDLFGAPK
jgi:hypothetical protein